MAKRDRTAEGIAKLAALKRLPDGPALLTDLQTLLGDASSHVVARAAAFVEKRHLPDASPALAAAFERLLGLPPSSDVGCAAKLALVSALVKLDPPYQLEDLFLKAARHEHFEAIYGGQADLAVGVRGMSVIGLATIGSSRVLAVAAELLAESDQSLRQGASERNSQVTRSDAARALTMVGTDAAAALLRFRVAAGDRDAIVFGDCVAGIIRIEGDPGLALAERYLAPGSAASPAHAEAVLLAVGESRHRGAFELLRRHAKSFIGEEAEFTFLTAVVSTRQDVAIDYLLELVRDSLRSTSENAAKVLQPLAALASIDERLAKALASRSKR